VKLLIVTKEAAEDLDLAMAKAQILKEARAQAIANEDFVLAKDLLTQFENACLDVRLVMLTHGLPALPVHCNVILPF